MRYSKHLIEERKEDTEMQRYIRSRALYSLAVLGMSFVTKGSGKYLNLRPPSQKELETRTA